MPVGQDLIIILVVVLIIVLLIRGPKALPKLGESLGQSISGFRRATREGDARRHGLDLERDGDPGRGAGHEHRGGPGLHGRSGAKPLGAHRAESLRGPGRNPGAKCDGRRAKGLTPAWP